MAALPAPVQPESLAVPGDHRLGFDDHQSRAPAVPHLGEPNPEKAIRSIQTQPAVLIGPVQDQELMSKSEDFSLHSQTSLKSPLD